ncbi:MAG: tetratricopeptide repeat protein [Xanthomonadales bacterium]|nr:Serine/threonine-protein kinase PknD [Xanthomonadales bacterium]MCC6592145.1 tetratricopeptide repeat protein [Xanthomonadales bacterium]
MNAEREEPPTAQYGETVVVPGGAPAKVDVLATPPAAAPLVGPGAWIGREIDDYRILRPIGAGGMGVVFLAQQRHPKRLVALKTLHAGLQQPDLLARFQQEAEILARLKHPGIAQIHSSGTTDAQSGGLPYIVMEYVEGAPLLEYSGTLPLRECVLLLMRICDAVEHAHIRGVIHRDLKPGNILVQADGQPKVLDFGVARLTGEQPGAAELTGIGMVVGTVAFMSPEQASGEPGAVDIRSDVYALGLMGYRMLSGQMPYEVSHQHLGKALQQICDTAPTPLSRHDRRYRGDLEVIFAKALAKDKEARYQNAAEFAEDLRRWLADEAILARRASVLADVRRFARRNKALVGAALVVLAALIAAVAVSTRFALQEQAQRREADAMVDFMRSMLSGANPVLAQGRDASVRELIAQSEPKLRRDLAEAPIARGRLRATLAETHRALGDDETALRYYAAAREDFLAAGAGGMESELVAVGAARALLERGRVQEARLELDRILASADAGADVTRAMASLHLAVALADLGEDADAQVEFERGFARLRRSPGSACPPCLPQWEVRIEVWARSHQSALQLGTGDSARALETAAAALEVARNRLGPDDPDTQVAMVHLSNALQAVGRRDEAIQLLRDALAERRRVLKDGHWLTMATANNLAMALKDEGQLDAASEMLRFWLEVAAGALDAGHPQVSAMKANLGTMLFEQGQIEEAVKLLQEAYDHQRGHLGESHPATLNNAMNLAVMYSRLAHADPARFDDAERLMRAALDGTIARFGAEHRQTIGVRSEYASLLRNRDRLDDAEREFAAAWALAQTQLPPGHDDRLRVLFQYSGLLQRQQRYVKAEALSAQLLAEAGAATNPNAIHARKAPLRHARSLIGLKRYDDAERLLLDYHARPAVQADPQLLRPTRETLVQLYEARGSAAQAQRYREPPP